MITPSEEFPLNVTATSLSVSVPTLNAFVNIVMLAAVNCVAPLLATAKVAVSAASSPWSALNVKIADPPCGPVSVRPEPLTNKAPVIWVEGPALALIIVSKSTPPTSMFRVSSAEDLIEVSASTSRSIRPTPLRSMSSTYSLRQAVPSAPKSSALSPPGRTLLPPGSRTRSAPDAMVVMPPLATVIVVVSVASSP